MGSLSPGGGVPEGSLFSGTHSEIPGPIQARRDYRRRYPKWRLQFQPDYSRRSRRHQRWQGNIVFPDGHVEAVKHIPSNPNPTAGTPESIFWLGRYSFGRRQRNADFTRLPRFSESVRAFSQLRVDGSRLGWAGVSEKSSQYRAMDEVGIDRIGQSVVRRGLEGAGEHDLLSSFCEACVQAGLPVASSVAVIDTLHPIWEGRVFLWRNDGVETESIIEYASSSGGEMQERWMRTSFYYLHSEGKEEVRRCIGKGESRDFERLDELHQQGHTDYLAMLNRFAADGTIGAMDCIFTHWTTQRDGGFTEDDLAALRRLVPLLALALKTASMTQIAKTVLGIYLGKDAGRQVLSGRITRGVSDRIETVLWFSDLSGFTKISDESAPDEVIPLLNDYAEVVISALHEAGGDVLKLIGDGTLAIFRGEDRAEACRSALRAHRVMERRLAEVNARRASEGRPITTVRLGLHVGEVFYGNIGSDDRLDFTVVGPAVNEVSRIVSMGRSVDRDLLVSQEFVETLPEEERTAFVSVGRFALRGVRQSKHLFTRDPELDGAPPTSLA